MSIQPQATFMNCHGDELWAFRNETERWDERYGGRPKIAAALVYCLKVQSSGLSLAQILGIPV